MSDVQVEPTVTLEGPTITIHFERKIGEDYGKAATIASFYYKRPIEDGESLKDVADRFRTDFAPLKAEVLDQLGLAYEYDPELHLVVEGAANMVTPAPRSEAQAVAAVEAAFQPTQPSNVVNLPVDNHGLVVIGKQNGPLPEWLAGKCAELGITQVLDNRDENGRVRISKNGKNLPPFLQNDEKHTAIWTPK